MTRLELAELSLQDARWNMQGSRYRSTVSRASFACYHAARACLEKRSIEVTGRNLHSGTLHLFSLHLIQPGPFPGWMARALNRLRDGRVAADYNARVEITEDLARQTVAMADEFLREVTRAWNRL